MQENFRPAIAPLLFAFAPPGAVAADRVPPPATEELSMRTDRRARFGCSLLAGRSPSW